MGLEIDIKNVISYIKNRMTYTFRIGNVYIALFSEKDKDEYELSAYMFGEQDKKKIVKHRCVVVDAIEVNNMLKKIHKECPNLLINQKVPA